MRTLIFGMLGYMDIILILGVVLILFGAKKVPELAKGLGTGIKEFKKATREVEEDLRSAIEDDPAPKVQQRQTPSASDSAKAD